MTTLQLFGFFGVPVAAVLFGLVVYFLEGRRRLTQGPDNPLHTPGE